MALEKKAKLNTAVETGGEKKGDLELLVAHVKENPLFYILGTAFIFVCLLFGGTYGLMQSAKDREIRTKYAEALQQEDPALVADSLEKLAENAGSWAPEVWYMHGEYSIKAQAYSKAEDAFKTVVEKFPNTDYAARATDGLGFIYINRGDYVKARDEYQELAKNTAWQDTLVAKRAQYNIGRVQEKLEEYEAAKIAYEKQISLFPGDESNPTRVSLQAEAALNLLREDHPELFPEDEVEITPVEEEDITPAEEDIEVSVDPEEETPENEE